MAWARVSKDGNSWMNLTGAVQQSFTPRERHVDQRLRVQISCVDGHGNLETLVSPPSTPVQNVNDKPTGAPRLAGIAREEDALVVDKSLIADEDGIASLSIGWSHQKMAAISKSLKQQAQAGLTCHKAW
jgi:hypothetical protein